MHLEIPLIKEKSEPFYELEMCFAGDIRISVKFESNGKILFTDWLTTSENEDIEITYEMGSVERLATILNSIERVEDSNGIMLDTKHIDHAFKTGKMTEGEASYLCLFVFEHNTDKTYFNGCNIYWHDNQSRRYKTKYCDYSVFNN